MESITLANRTAARIVLIVEPIADEYVLEPGDKVELSGPLYLYQRQTIEMEIVDGAIVVFAPEDILISRNGKRITPEGLSQL